MPNARLAMSVNTKEYNHVIDLILENARAEYDKQINDAGMAYYTIIIQPIESKYNLKYCAGNGEWFFIHLPTDNVIRQVDIEYFGVEGITPNSALTKELCDVLEPVFDMLNTDMNDGDYFGYHV